MAEVGVTDSRHSRRKKGLSKALPAEYEIKPDARHNSVVDVLESEKVPGKTDTRHRTQPPTVEVDVSAIPRTHPEHTATPPTSTSTLKPKRKNKTKTKTKKEL